MLEAALERAQAGRGRRDRPRRRARRRQEPAQPRVRPALPRARASRSSRRRRRRTGRSIPFMPVLQMLRSFFGIGERDPEQLAREKIAGRALLLDPGFAEDLPLMFDFLGVPDPDRPVPQMSAEARQRALGGIVCRLVNAPGRRKTLVLVIEDLHWIDEGSAAMLGDLIESIAAPTRSRCVNYRPEYEPAWAERRRLPRRSALEPLAGPTPPSCCATWPARTPRSTGSTSRSTSAPRATRSSSRRSSASWPSPATWRASAAPTAWPARSRTPACRSPCRRSSPPGSTASSPTSKQLLQVASVVGKEVSAEALGLTAGLEDGADRPRPLRADRGRLPLRSRDLPAAGARLPPPADPRGRLRDPARRPARGDPRGGGAGDDRARARAASTSSPAWSPTTWTKAARPSKRRAGSPAPRTGPATASRATSLRLWQRVTALADELEEDEETAALALASRMLQLEYAWRLGMDRAEAERAGGRGDGDRRRAAATCARWRC